MDPRFIPLSSPEVLDLPYGQMPLASATFFADELLRGVPEFEGDRGIIIDEPAAWREIVEDDDSVSAEASFRAFAARHGDFRVADMRRFLQLRTLQLGLLHTLNERISIASGLVLSLLQQHPPCRDTGDLAAAGLLDACRPIDFGLPYWDWTCHVPPDLDEALILRRWLAEHPPCVAS
jgi:hypothetical protein